MSPLRPVLSLIYENKMHSHVTTQLYTQDLILSLKTKK